jgi:pimeloyl-ACP methyl ester carboxylesterase
MKHLLGISIFDNFTANFAFALLIGASLILMAMVNSTSAQNSAANKTVVLVHGAFADGSSWDKVIPLLQAKGLNVVSVQNPLTSLADDVAATKRAIDASAGQVILVGHSWGGTVITQAGTNEKVSALVYVAAFAPSKDQTSNDLSKDYPKPEWLGSFRADSGGFLTLSPDAVANFFAQDLTAAQTSLMAVTQGPIFAGCFDEKVTETAWSSKPSRYIVAALDRRINPDLQKVMAKKIGAQATILQTSHVPMLSKPNEVAEVILAAAGTSKK